jgi:hypothetical protein
MELLLFTLLVSWLYTKQLFCNTKTNVIVTKKVLAALLSQLHFLAAGAACYVLSASSLFGES